MGRNFHPPVAAFVFVMIVWAVVVSATRDHRDGLSRPQPTTPPAQVQVDADARWGGVTLREVQRAEGS